jgi:hypothetical protein
MTEVTDRERAVKKSEIGHYIDLGLGLGVDATDPKPWTNKKSFRARHVTFEDLIGIKGGILNAFDHEVKSVREFQSSMNASIPISKILSVGIDAEASRSYSMQRRSIGRKIITRTIEFKSEFKNIPHERTETDFIGENQLSFEIQLTDFITRRTKKNVESLSMDSLADYCFQFVASSAVTHYVYSIELGACHYRTTSQEEYTANFGAAENLGMDRIANIVLEHTTRVKTHKFQTSIINLNWKIQEERW